jgi:hypothetical protein
MEKAAEFLCLRKVAHSRLDAKDATTPLSGGLIVAKNGTKKVNKQSCNY